jgi:hypothetical protein
MIPDNLRDSDVLWAIQQIRERNRLVPPSQRSKDYCLAYAGHHYPPKVLVRWANERVNGEELWGFKGGPETNRFLQTRGFEIERHGGAPHP